MSEGNQEILTRLDALEQTFLARLETIRAEREHGDKQLEQADRFIRENVKENTKYIAQNAAIIERMRNDQQSSFDAVRAQIRQGIKDALESSHASVQTSAADTKVALERQDKATEKIINRVTDLEGKWKLVRGIGIGLSVTTLINAAAVVTLLQEVGPAIP